MKGLPLKCEIRHLKGSRNANRLRRQGFVPAVIYGMGEDNISLKILKHELSQIMHSKSGEHALVELHMRDESGEEKKLLALIKEVQHNPVTDLIIHADFEHVQADRPVSFKLHIEFIGIPEGVHKGGIFTPHFHELEVLCTPKNAPEFVELDVSGIDLSDSIHVKDIKIPNAELLMDEEEVIASVVKPRGVTEVEEVEEVEELEEAEEVEGTKGKVSK